MNVELRGGFERRIGERRPVDPLAVEWITRRSELVGVLKRRQFHTTTSPGRVVDVSVSGAAIEAPAHPDVTEGALAAVRVDGREAVVEVRRLTPTSDPGIVRYGVEFREVEPELRDFLHRILARGRPGEGIWLTAR